MDLTCISSFQIIAKSKGLKWKDVKRLGQLQESLSISLKDMAGLVGELLHKEAYSKQEICDILGVTSEELAGTSLSPNTLQGSYKRWDLRLLVFEVSYKVQHKLDRAVSEG